MLIRIQGAKPLRIYADPELASFSDFAVTEKFNFDMKIYCRYLLYVTVGNVIKNTYVGTGTVQKPF
jgi:hypothetical protein